MLLNNVLRVLGGSFMTLGTISLIADEQALGLYFVVLACYLQLLAMDTNQKG